MDPIKVDFSGRGGADKSREIVIPPEKALLKLILSAVFALLTGGVLYYFMLPPLNFKAFEFYIFIGAVIVSFVVFLALFSGAFRHSEYIPYVKKKAIIPAILIGVLALAVLIGYLVGCQFFRAKSYSQLLTVQTDCEFSQDIRTDFNTIPKLDADAARAVADKAMGDLNKQGKVSQYKIYEGTAASSNYPQINYKGRPTRLAMLQYGNIIKWITNMKDGLKGYIRIDAANEKQKFQNLDNPIRYSLSDHFGRHVKRVVRFQYPTYIFDAPSFEIDDQDNPYWVVPRIDKRIGLFGGRDVVGIVLVDAVTGDCTYYTIEQVRDETSLRWIDRVYSDDLILEQFGYYGMYQQGFWNSILGQDDCVKTTDGSNYIALDDDVWLYTGVTSMNNDNSIVGFVLVNQRTKETRYYDDITGSTELSAAESARQDVAEKEGYTASFPLLLNIGGNPTYFTAIKDSNNIVQMYGMVHVEEFNKVKVTDNTIAGCYDKYLAAMTRAKIDYDPSADRIVVSDEMTADPETPAAEVQTVTGRVTQIRSAVIDGNTTYYLQIEGSDAYYAVSAAESEQAVILNTGDTIRATVSGSDPILRLKNLEIVPATE